jgi:hypothetical protein
MELLIERIFAPAFVLVGVSHLLHAKRWAEMFVRIRETGFGGFIVAVLTLPLGLFLIVTHSRWVLDWPLLLTLAGWGMTIKSVVYLLRPQVFDRVLEHGRHAGAYVPAGLLMTVCGAMLSYQAWFQSGR